ncbi:MAG: histidine kinase [Citromicrobium sp.]|nr:histidine kinase [Citromicrobium sp.]
MSDGASQVDLTSCDREPIHQLGAIQPFGAMLVVSTDNFIAHFSQNATDFLGLKGIEQGARLGDVLSPDALQALQGAAARLEEPEDTERLFALSLDDDPARRFDCSIHRSGGQLMIEFERHDPAGFGNHIASIRPMMAGLDAIEGVDALCDAAAQRLKALLEFDRVMVYRFHPDGTGEVIAEAREREIDSFSGLRYPKSDIPAQARELYLRNRLRIISNVNDTPVPVVPRTHFGEPLDLSLSTLRSVSPIHIEYLRNMGVRASLSISIIVRGRLWGLFACHHYRPRVLPFSNRTAAEVFSQIFSLTLDRALHDQGTARRALGQNLHERLMTRLAGGASLRDTLTQVGTSIGDSIPHDGASIFIDGEYVATGHAPTEEEFRELLPMLHSGPAGRILASSQLTRGMDAAKPFAARAAGALIIPVSRSPRDYFVLWRRELKQVVTWAGNPEKPVEDGANGDRVSPRKSFAAWQQTVEGRSADWTQPELDLAETLRITLLEVILRLTDAAAQDRKRAGEQQDLLIAELNHRVRNILNLIRGLVNQSRHETGDAVTLTKLIGGRIGALAAAHDNLTRDNWGPTSLKKLIADEADAYLGAKTSRLSVEGRDVLIVPQAYTVLALVLHEMITNSAKYGSLSDHSGDLLITLDRQENGDLELGWKERGGPPVKAPERRGFGSTIIDKSIPHELQGEARVDFALSGVEACFVIPARYLQDAEKEHEMADQVDHGEETPEGGGEADLPERVLLIEDNMIIALDTEEMLRELGVSEVLVSASVTQALRAIEADKPDFAVLDFNLGEESSEPVARELARHDVPFVLATGYSAKEVRFEELGARAIIKKPYDKSDLAKVLSA